jgi:hypothetical protein
MSDCILRIIPRDPGHLPGPAAQGDALALIRILLPTAAEVRAIVHDEIVFVDPGGNLESVACPRCAQQLSLTWWSDAMGIAHALRFSDLVTAVPCCGARLSLNDLDYSWPAGFARFLIEAREPPLRDWLDADAVARIETALATRVRQILARY